MKNIVAIVKCDDYDPKNVDYVFGLVLKYLNRKKEARKYLEKAMKSTKENEKKKSL